MEAKKVILSGIAGTTLMTLFSYMVSELADENFNEPDLLAQLIEDAIPADKKDAALPAGWAGHYAIGLAFSVAYHALLKAGKLKPNALNGLAFGALGGIAGILSWKLFFKSHPAPPNIDFKKYYTQLFFAHCVYGAAAGETSRLLK